MDRRQVIWGIGAGLALGGCGTTNSGPGALRIDLLGQALIEHAPTATEWPGRTGVVDFLRQADVVFTNLETVIRGFRAEAPTRELLTLHASSPAVLNALKATGVDLMTTANNHAFDLGSGHMLRPRFDAVFFPEGTFNGFKKSPLDRGYTLKTVIAYLRTLTSAPILTGLPFGHVPTKLCLPLGRKVNLVVQGRDVLVMW